MSKNTSKLRIEALKAWLSQQGLPKIKPAGRPHEVVNPNIPDTYFKF